MLPLKTRVVLASGCALFREGVRSILERESEILILGEAKDGADAVQLAEQLEPDILLLDWVMPRMTGLLVLREIKALALRTRAIVLTSSAHVAETQQALESGARGLVVTDSGTLILLRAIRSVMAGECWIDRTCLTDLAQSLRRHADDAACSRSKRYGLTARELEIVSAVAAAFANKEIARRFSISEKTVKHHLTNIFDKTGVSNRLELALFAHNHDFELADVT
jgi:two-component system, NarL family, nitrate/nitrite response regulator NarL